MFPIKQQTCLPMEKAGWADKFVNRHSFVYPTFHVVWGLSERVGYDRVPHWGTLQSQS